jgi:2-polyprenyl-3-methyl-5-hydroxy-6-metoxy-1,4-benzoquinol methylase
MNSTIELNHPPRDCEVCGGTATRLLFPQRFVTMSEGSLFNGYDVVACTHCGHCYADRLPPQETFDRYYRDMSKYEMPADSSQACSPAEFDVARFRFTVEKIKGFVPDRQARIFEIGCATGLLLSQLKEAGYTEVQGLDPSPVCAQLAEKFYGVPVHTGTLSDDLSQVGKVDLLILIGVMEHIRTLSSALEKMSGLLAPGGRFFITVPDASMYFQGEDAPFQEFSMEHINYFGPRSLANLMAQHGFKTLFTEQGMQRCSARTVTPVLHAAFEKLPAGQTPAWEKDTATAAGLERYVEKSERENRAVQPALESLADSRKPVIIWGAGSHTLRLLATSRLAEANLVAVVDSNPRYQGKTMSGVPIIKPAALAAMPGTILISSRPAQQAIQHQITQVLRLPNEVVTLYPLG